MPEEERTGTSTEGATQPRVRWRKRDGARAAASDSDGASASAHASADAQTADAATALSDEQIAALENVMQERLAAEQAKTEEAVQRLQRTAADFANYKRRSEQEREQQAVFATTLLISELLPVLDNFDRALATIPEDLQQLPWTDGIRLVERQLRATLEKQGLKPIEAVGRRFDPMLHEAIIHEESADHPDDEVITELRRGYMMHDKVVRPTLVKVAKNVAPSEQAQEEK